MNYLKKFESFQTNDEIHEICEEYDITNYTINSDGSIDVKSHINLAFANLEKLPLKFNEVDGYFECSNNNLTTLEGAPKYVNGSFFNCSNNKLTTLKGAPFMVDGFYCSNNKLTTLEGAPQSVRDDFICSSNYLTTLEGAPQSVGGDFDCASNELTTLEGAPQSVASFYCSINKNLKSLNYISKEIIIEEVRFNDTAVYEIFKLLGNDSLGMIRLVNDVEVVVDDKIDIEKLNDLLYDQGKSPVEKVKGYDNI